MHAALALDACHHGRGVTGGVGRGTAVSTSCCCAAPCLLPPRTKIRSWHLAYTRVTPAVTSLLSSCDEVVMLDLRGSGVRAAQLAPLRARFALSMVQGAVLSRTAAMVLAAVTWEQFVCADAAQHGAAVAASTVGAPAAAAGQQVSGRGCSSQQWVNQGVAALLQAAADVAAPPLPGQHPVPAFPFHQQWR